MNKKISSDHLGSYNKTHLRKKQIDLENLKLELDDKEDIAEIISRAEE